MNEKMIRRYIAGIFLMTLFNIPMRLAASGLIVDLSLNSGGLFYPKSILFESTDGVQSFTSGMLSNQMDLSIWKEGYPLTVTLSGGYSFVPFLPKSDYKILNSPTIRNLDILIGLNSAWRQVSVNVSAGYSYVSQLYKVEWSPYSESFSKNNFAPALAVSIHPDTDTNYSLGFYYKYILIGNHSETIRFSDWYASPDYTFSHGKSSHSVSIGLKYQVFGRR